MKDNYPKSFPKQHQVIHPGKENEMNPRPIYEVNYPETKRLKDKVAIITGGDSGIGRAVAVAYANEGANVAIVYYNEDMDAEETKGVVEGKGVKCLSIRGDIADENFCINVIQEVINKLGRLDILVNNAGVQYVSQKLEDITSEQLEKTFKTNVFGAFYLTKAALPHMKDGANIINTTSVTAYKGNETLIDYSSTKGALTAFTRSLAINLADRGIRVNAVAPGPIWTPLIPSSFDAEKVSKFGENSSLKRAGQPEEVAGAYVFLALDSSSYITGETIHVNGGEIVNG